MSYAPYPAYKDSGVPWLGQVPEGWDVKRLRYASKLADERLPYDEVQRPYVGLEHIESWTGKRIPDDDARADGIVAMFERGDVLFGKLRPYLAKVHRAEEAGCSSTEALILRGNPGLDTHFLKYFMLSPAFIDEVNATTYGAKMPRANWSDIGGLPVSLPPIKEQTAIADFLDKKTAEIDDLIAKKEELLRLLAEQRTALITHAVTKGLNPNAPMKPSGIDWLDEMPQHWVNPRIQHVVQLRSGEAITSGSIADAGDFPVYGGNGFRGYSDRYTHKGDFVLVGRQGALCGNVNYASGKFWASEHALVANPLREFVVDWMGELLRAMNLNQYSVSAAQPGLSVDNIAKLRIPLPPIEEQREIATHIKRETLDISNVEKAAEKAIKKLREYRTALITNAVTGKIKVA